MSRVSSLVVLITLGAVLNPITVLAAQVEGDVSGGSNEVVAIRDTDGRLGPLVTTLLFLGAIALVMTILYWIATRPKYQLAHDAEPASEFDESTAPQL